jgi:hypothetical protein
MLRKDQTNPKSRTDKRRKESMANSIPISFSFFLVITQPNKPNEEAPVGFIPNNRDGRHFYPI